MIVFGRKYKDGSVTFSKDGYFIVNFGRDLSNNPTYRNRYIVINGHKYHIMWDKRK